jgi:hypothetical protein
MHPSLYDMRAWSTFWAAYKSRLYEPKRDDIIHPVAKKTLAVVANSRATLLSGSIDATPFSDRGLEVAYERFFILVSLRIAPERYDAAEGS